MRFCRPSHLAAADLAGCMYLRACVDEAPSISPLMRTGLLREVAGPSGLIVDGHVMPMVCEVGVRTCAIHHSTRAFEYPSVSPSRLLTCRAVRNPKAAQFSHVAMC